jgi:hypothetical protein
MLTQEELDKIVANFEAQGLTGELQSVIKIRTLIVEKFIPFFRKEDVSLDDDLAVYDKIMESYFPDLTSLVELTEVMRRGCVTANIIDNLPE